MGYLKNLFECSSFWSQFWPAIPDAGAGALIAFALERSRRERERISAEAAKANRLIANMGRLLNNLGDIDEMLFVGKPAVRLLELHRGPMRLLGDEGSPAHLEAADVRSDIEFFHTELDDEIPTVEKLFKEMIGELRAALTKRYPKRQFIKLFPKHSTAPAV